NENNASIVMYLEIYRHDTATSALFTGDLEEDGAQEILKQDNFPQHVDILKLSHHGAKNGGTALIEKTQPQTALIGVGEENSYGHPHPEILGALGTEVEIYRTDLDGTFALIIDRNPPHGTSRR